MMPPTRVLYVYRFQIGTMSHVFPISVLIVSTCGKMPVPCSTVSLPVTRSTGRTGLRVALELPAITLATTSSTSRITDHFLMPYSPSGYLRVFHTRGAAGLVHYVPPDEPTTRSGHNTRAADHEITSWPSGLWRA